MGPEPNDPGGRRAGGDALPSSPQATASTAGRARDADLFERAPEPYLLTDRAGTVLRANTRAAQLFGDEAGQIAGRPLAAFVHPDERPGLAQQLDRAAGGQGIHAWEVRLAAGAAEPRVLASVEPVGTDGEDLELRWVLWDALPLELVRDRFHRLLEDSRGDAAALRALSQWQASLLGSVAQDMRTPLEVVSTTLGSLLEDPATLGSPVAAAMLERASRQVTRLRRLLPTLLQLGRLQLEGPDTARSRVELRAVIDEVLDDLRPLEVDLTHQLQVDSVRTDQLQLARVLVELVLHVTEHGPAGAALRFGSLRSGVDVELFLDVEGYEMTQEARQAVLSPLLAPGDDDGADVDGLGLSLVTVFARMHGGRAWIQDAPGGGISFRLLLSNALPDAHDERDADD